TLLGQPPSAFLSAATPTAAVSAYCTKLPLGKSKLRSRLDSALLKVRNSGLKLASGRVTIRKIRPENGSESWKKHFKPLEISRALLVKPTWSGRRPRAGQAV